jgi:hypothetical protein
MGRATAVQTAVSQHLNNAWKPRAGSVACANRIRNTFLHPDHVLTLGKGAIRIERQHSYGFRNNSGSLPIFAAICRAR